MWVRAVLGSVLGITVFERVLFLVVWQILTNPKTRIKIIMRNISILFKVLGSVLVYLR